MAEDKKRYSAEEIKVLEGLEGVRKRFDVVELSRRFKRKGDIIILANELKIRPRILNEATDEGRVLAILPSLQKSKASILARLKTNREIRLFANRYDVYNLSARKLSRSALIIFCCEDSIL